MSTSIIRAGATSDNFSILSNRIIRETRLSYRARGVLIRLLSNAEGFSMSADELASESQEGRDAVRSALRELREVGYLKTEKMQDERGRWTTKNIIYDVPSTSRELENRRLENRTSVNRPSDSRQSVSQALKEEVPVEVTGELLREIPKNQKSLVDLAIDDIFSHWKLAMQHPGARLDSKRTRVISARLDDGYTVPDLKLAIDGCKLSPFHMGQNDQAVVYDGIEVIFKNAGNVDKFIARASRKPMMAGGALGSSLSLAERAALMDWGDDDERGEIAA